MASDDLVNAPEVLNCRTVLSVALRASDKLWVAAGCVFVPVSVVYYGRLKMAFRITA